MNARTVEITVSPTGQIAIEAVAFTGADCERATRFLEEALGVVGKKTKKPEFYRRTRQGHQQKLGG